MLWHERSWPQIQALDKNLPVVVPLGSIEQHGHHLPPLR
jgi:creatinine amidohydrolase